MEVCKAGLQATLLVRHPESKELFVNMDCHILTMIRETECMARMGLDIPLMARTMRSRQGEYKDICSRLQVSIKAVAEAKEWRWGKGD